MEEKLTCHEASLVLGVSEATVTNWLNSGFLSSLTREGIEGASNLSAGPGRLTSRANKRASSRRFSPREYGSLRGSELRKLSDQTEKLSLKYEPSALLFRGVGELLSFLPEKPDNPFLYKELDNWKKELDLPDSQPKALFPPIIADMDDFPGWLYQSLQKEGEKSLKGSYYTPTEIVDSLLDLGIRTGDKSFYDPCCGTGRFLCRAAQRLGDPQKVIGQDSDPVAVRLARINLMILFPRLSFNPRIYLGNSLLTSPDEIKGEGADCLVTNPPWGFRFSGKEKEELNRKYNLNSGESGSYMAAMALRNLSPRGRAVLLLPESLLHRERHRDFRQLVKDRTRKIYWYGKLFSRVQSECMGIVLGASSGTSPGSQSKSIKIIRPEVSYACSSRELGNNPLESWDILSSPPLRKIWKKLSHRKHYTLKNRAEWGLGIVTGDNNNRLSGKGQESPILTGKEIAPFKIKPARYSLDYKDSRIHQKAPRELYGRTKIVYRFIAPRPIAALDETGSLTLNSLNFVIVPEEDMRILVMLLNSTLYGLYFKKTFHTLKVLRSQLESLPLPYLSTDEKSELEALYPRLIEDDNRDAADELDRLVFNLFDLTPEERNTIEKEL